MIAKQFTIFGAGGFVGTRLVRHLKNAAHPVNAVTRSNLPVQGAGLGHVVYAIGITADFRSRPFDAVAAHVSRLAEVLQNYKFDSFLYLSSARIYRGAADTREEAEICIAPSDPDRLYDATKLAGEALCLALPNPAIRVARLSNLYGPHNHLENFLSQVLNDALRTGRVTIQTGPQSAKDYLHVDDACSALTNIALTGQSRIFNVASGHNVTNKEIAWLVIEHAKAEVFFAPGAPDIISPPIDTSRLASQFSWQPRLLKDMFSELVKESAA